MIIFTIINPWISILYIVLFQFYMGYAQIDPVVYKSIWMKAGIPGGIPYVKGQIINVLEKGAVADGTTDNYNLVQALIDASASPCVIFFPTGTYRIDGQLELKSGIVLRGEGAQNTHLEFYSPNGCISIHGALSGSYFDIHHGLEKGSNKIVVSDASNFTIGMGGHIRQGLVKEPIFTAWVEPRPVGQVVRINGINGDTLVIEPGLNFDYINNPPIDPDNGPEISEVRFIENAGIEFLHIKRIHSDDGGGSNINISRAANSWIQGVESEYTLKYHLAISQSLNMTIRNNYIHHARSKGDGGQGYGVSLAHQSTACLVEDNIFSECRHSMIIQLGVNGCVFGYNYAERNYSDDGWDKTYISLHGHYVHTNLFEGNIVGWIGIGDYWGPDGPDNTLFRNRVLGTDRHKDFGDNRGIIYVDFDGSQYIVGNEVTGGDIYYVERENGKSDPSLVVVHGNNVKGSIDWIQDLSREFPKSYYLEEKPAFFDSHEWPSLGSDKVLGEGTIPALERWRSGNYISNMSNDYKKHKAITCFAYPNSSYGIFNLNIPNIKIDGHVALYDVLGRLLWSKTYLPKMGILSDIFNISSFPKGIYLLIFSMDCKIKVQKIILYGR